MSKNFVIREDAARARFVPMRVVEPNFRREVRPGFPRGVRAIINAQIQLDALRTPMDPPRDDYIYGYNAGKRAQAQAYAAEAHLAALKAGDWDSANRIRKKFQLTFEQLESHVDALTDEQWAKLQEKGNSKKNSGKLDFLQNELKDPPSESLSIVDELSRIGHIIMSKDADKVQVFAAYCTKLVENILNGKSA